MLTAARLRELFEYCPETGVFTRLVATGGARVGDRAGYTNSAGYTVFNVDMKKYLAHRLAWLYMTGEWPNSETVDHKDRDRTNSRFTNLRLASRAQNLCNTPMSARNRSGFKGVCWCNKRMKWRATIQVQGIAMHLGYFDALHEAADAASEARTHHQKEFRNL